MLSTRSWLYVLIGFVFIGNASFADEIPYALDDQVIEFTPITGGEGVKMLLNAKIFSKAGAPDINSTITDPVGKFLHSAISANQSGDKNAILLTWAPGERQSINRMMSDDEVVAKNAAFYQNVTSSKLMGMILQGECLLAYVRHDVTGTDSFIKVYPLVFEKGSYYLSNVLKNDYFFTQFSSSVGDYIWQ